MTMLSACPMQEGGHQIGGRSSSRYSGPEKTSCYSKLDIFGPLFVGLGVPVLAAQSLTGHLDPD